MEQRVFERTWIQGKAPIPDDLSEFAFQGEASADTFVIDGKTASGSAVNITGTIIGVYLGENNNMVPLVGTVSDGKATVTLDDPCYKIPGRFILSIYAVNGTQTICIYCGIGIMFRTQSGRLAYPSKAIPDIQDLIERANAVIADVNTAVEAAQSESAEIIESIEAKGEETIASIPSDYTDLSNDVEDLKSKVNESEYWPNSTETISGGGLTFVRNGSQVKINGTSNASIVQLKLDGTLGPVYTSSTGLIDTETATKNIKIIKYHDYSFSLNKISGNISDASKIKLIFGTDAVSGSVDVGLDAGNATAIGLDDDSATIYLQINTSGVSFTNFVCDCSFNDITGSKTLIDAIKADVSELETTVGNTPMGTTADTITGAIAEQEADLSDLKTAVNAFDAMADTLVEETQTQGWVKLHSVTQNTSQQTGLTIMDALIRSPGTTYPGKINAATDRKTFWFQAVSAMQVYITGTTPLRLRVSTEEPAAGNTQPFTGDLYASDDSTLPTQSNPVSVAAGKYVAFCSINDEFSIDFYSLEESYSTYALKSNVGLTSEMTNETNEIVGNETTKWHNSSDVLTYTWGVGGFTNTTGSDIRVNLNGALNRRSTPVIEKQYPVAVGNTFAYQVRISIANSSYVIVTEGTFSAGNFVVIPANTPFRITARNQSDTDISELPDSTLNENIYIKGLFPNGYAPVRWCAMGDSITQGWHSEVSGNSTTSEKDASLGWVSKVAMINGWQLTNMGIGSTGWLDETEGSGSAQTPAYYLATHTDFTPYNLVTLAYGINDWKANLTVGSYTDAPDGNTPTTVMQAMRATIEGIMTSNPTCKIIVILPLNCVGYSHSYGDKSTNYGLGYAFTHSGTLESFAQKMIEVCNYYGIQYIDQTHYSCINRENLLTMLPDGVHPSANAHTILANELAKKITF